MREEKDLLLQEAILMKRYQTYLKDPLIIEVYLRLLFLLYNEKPPACNPCGAVQRKK